MLRCRVPSGSPSGSHRTDRVPPPVKARGRGRAVLASLALLAASSAIVVGAGALPAGAVVTGPGTNVTSVVPARLLDTRPNEKTTDGIALGGGKIAAAGVVELQVTGRGGVPVDQVGAVVLNVTVTEPVAAGSATVFPTGAAQPRASNLNYVTGQTVANVVVAKVGTGGKVSIFTQSSAHLVADVTGYVLDQPGFAPVVPARLLDTRADGETIDGKEQRAGAAAAGATVKLPVLGRGGVPAIGVGAVVLNVTVTEPVGPGFVTVWPTGSERPHASNLNMANDQTVPNLVVAKVGTDGTVSIFTTARAHLVADVTAWVTDVPGISPLVPTRVLDTRPNENTIDGVAQAEGVVAAEGSVDLLVVGRGGVPAVGAAAVLLNVTVVDPAAPGFVTVWPSGELRPLASNLNYVAGQIVPNLVLAKIGAGGKVSLFTQSSAHLVADVVGYIAAPASPNWTFEPARWVNTGQPELAGYVFNGLNAVSGDGRYAAIVMRKPSGLNTDLRVLVADRATQKTRLTSIAMTILGPGDSPEGILVGNDGRVAVQKAAAGPWSLWDAALDTVALVDTCQLPPMGYLVAVPTSSALPATYCRLSDASLITNVETASPSGRFLVTSGTAVRLVDEVTGVATVVGDAYAGSIGPTSLSDWGDLATWAFGPPDTVTVRQLDGTTKTSTGAASDTFSSVDFSGNGGAVVIVHGDSRLEVDDLASGPIAVPVDIMCGLRAGGSILWATLGSCVV